MCTVNTNGVDIVQLTKIFNSFITEEQLNHQIRSAQDIPVLRSLLEIKLQLINSSKQSPMLYSIDLILNKCSSKEIEKICDVVQVALTIQDNVSEYLKFVEFVNRNLSPGGESLQFLKMLEVALTLCKLKREKVAFIKYIDDNHLDTVISALINTDNKTIINFLNVNILPQYLSLNSKSSKQLFREISSYSLETKKLDIFCSIPQLFIENNDDLMKDDNFWCLLQNCLNNNNSMIQKQSLYLLKKALKACQRHDNFSSVSGVVYWNEIIKKEVSLAWYNLFILYEVSREKQLHLIEPVYQLIPTIQVLHPSWLCSIFRILLSHPQTTVCTYTLIDLLKSKWCYTDIVFKDVVQCLVPAINKTEFALNKSIWTHLSKFTQNLSKEKFILLLQESVKISWIPSVCYKFYTTVLNTQKHVLSISLCAQIISSLRKLPHKFIREDCLRVTFNYIKEAYCGQINFKDYMELNKIFFNVHYQFWEQNDLQKFIPEICIMIQSWVGNETVNLNEVETLINIIQSTNNDFEDILYKHFENDRFNSSIQDRLCVLLLLRHKNVLSYIQNRLLKIYDGEDAYLKHVAPLLPTVENKEILRTCFQVLLDNESSDSQIEICFTIVKTLLNEIKDTIVLEEILSKWEKIFLDNKNCNPSTCICFVQIFSKKRLDLVVDHRQFLQIIQLFENILETQDFDVVPEIFLQLKFLINACVDVETLFPFIDLCVQKLFELKGSKFFKIAAENFINSILLNNVILYSGNESVLEKCGDLLRLLFDWVNSSEDIGYSLSTNLNKLSEIEPDIAFKFISVGLKLLVFGDILKKDQRAEYDVCQIISETNTEKQGKNPNLRKIAIRGEMIKYLKNILDNDHSEKRTAKADAIAVLLLKKYSRYINKRCFSDSEVHLIKLRILQALLLIHDYMEHKEELIDSLLNSLCTESHQLSNKFIVVWLLIRLLYSKDNCLDMISAKIESTSKLHSSTIFAFIPILYHIAILKNNIAFLFNIFKQLLPWTMGAHFNLRLYAQVGIKKLYEVFCQTDCQEEVRDKFKDIADGVIEVLNKTEREVETIDKYVFDVFNPITDFNLQTIYYVVPYITNVTNDEYENLLDILNCTVSISPNLDCLRTVQLRSPKKVNETVTTSIIQKKIIPQESFNRKTGELIVVASLVDKIPNLGGLSRTSEIFGVKELITNSLTTVKNAEFQNLSMSSENWINITEVKVDNLQSFLLSMKEKGYSIVGAEQTSESVKLNNFRFPFKCILLLGNEKEGIPPNLLSLIDTCVEIPQLGVVRSLNVHVAAATFIWEYTKIHVL